LKELNTRIGAPSRRERTLFVGGVEELVVRRNDAGNVQQNILLYIVSGFHDFGFFLFEAISGGNYG
jgi:hypothetical protein